MRRVTSPSILLASVFLAACTGAGGSSTDAVGPDGSPEPTPDTGWPAGDIGSFHVAHHVNTGETDVYAVALASDPGFVNFAQCGIEETVCIGGLPPDPDTLRDFDPDQDLDRDAVTTRYLGAEVSFGPYTMPYREDPDGFGYYYLDGTGLGYAQGWYGETWGGQWPEYGSTHDLSAPRPIELVSPRPGGFLEFTNGQTAPIEWVPTGEGQVTLAVVPKFGDGKLFLLEDDGHYDLLADDLGLGGDLEELTFILQRWSIDELSRFGHLVRVMATSDVVFEGQLLNVGGRDEIEPSDHCDQAQGGPALEAGFYWGFLGRGLTGDLDPDQPSCLGSAPDADSNGVDGLFRIEVEPHHNVSVDYNTLTESASVYFLEDCTDEDTCLAGSDLSPDPNVHEFVHYFNPGDETRTLYLGVDATDPGPESLFTLDVTDELLGTPDAHDFCADAEVDDSPEAPGSYYADFVAYTNQLNPGIGGCAGTSLPGPESIVPVELPPKETLDVSVDMPGADVALYLLLDCDNVSSCAAGSDMSLSAPEAVQYTNNSSYPQTVYVVVDSKSGLAPYFLNISY